MNSEDKKIGNDLKELLESIPKRTYFGKSRNNFDQHFIDAIYHHKFSNELDEKFIDSLFVNHRHLNASRVIELAFKKTEDEEAKSLIVDFINMINGDKGEKISRVGIKQSIKDAKDAIVVLMTIEAKYRNLREMIASGYIKNE
jgi:hypothetical protein